MRALGLLLLVSLALPLGADPVKTITTEAQARQCKGKVVRFRGKAVNAKISAAVDGKTLLIYNKGLGEWPGTVVGKEVVIEGKLELDDSTVVKPGEPIRQGTEKPVWVMRAATYTTARR